jgi:hypothetical protein
LTDYWLVKTVAQALRLRKLPSLREDIAIVPAGGVARLLPLGSMLIGHDVEIGAVPCSTGTSRDGAMEKS